MEKTNPDQDRVTRRLERLFIELDGALAAARRVEKAREALDKETKRLRLAQEMRLVGADRE